MQHFSDCDGSAIFGISSKQVGICTNSYQHRIQFKVLTYFGGGRMSLGCSHKLQKSGGRMFLGCSQQVNKRLGTHVLRVLSNIEFCALAPDFFIIHFRLPYSKQALVFTLCVGTLADTFPRVFIFIVVFCIHLSSMHDCWFSISLDVSYHAPLWSIGPTTALGRSTASLCAALQDAVFSFQID
jgi:hypothetical protein